jgi:predicted DCC family thiol-disulfide oxidoreductase YuxK
LLSKFEVNTEYLNSLVLIEGGEIFFRSTAALKISRNLSGLWPIFYGLIILPVGFRDWIYDWIGKNRYRWFGKKNTCRLPTPEERAKFI